MFIVTNRKIFPERRGLNKFGKRPNEKGPNELRVAEVQKRARGWRVNLIEDTLDAKTTAALGYKRGTVCTGSCLVAHKVLERARKNKRNVLLFVHGYNNDVESVFKRASNLEQLYGVEVVAFSWPANGGGMRGVASYKSDKRDAKASVGALDRSLAKMADYLEGFVDAIAAELHEKSFQAHPDNPEKRDALLARLTQAECPISLNMLVHSMGNYLYKHLVFSTASEGNRLLFDNIILAAADANNEDHARWIDRIRCRKRVYVTINEDDHALRVSRIKTGDEQRARLGHSVFSLDSEQGVYVNFTDAAFVKNSHAYFEGTPVRKNSAVKRFFKMAVNGQIAEDSLRYRDDRNFYEFRARRR